MTNPIPPSGGARPTDSPHSSTPPAAPFHSGGGGTSSMTEFMKLFTPEQRKKFMNILVSNLSREITKCSERTEKLMRKQREESGG